MVNVSIAQKTNTMVCKPKNNEGACPRSGSARHCDWTVQTQDCDTSSAAANQRCEWAGWGGSDLSQGSQVLIGVVMQLALRWRLQERQLFS